MTKVLVIDDDDSLLRALRIGLTARGYEVHLARSGGEGVAQAALVGPDVIVLDLGLGDLDGLEVCRRIRSWSSVPVVVLSAAGDERRKVAALDGGADDYITKPFSMAELEARLRVAVRHSGATAGEVTTELLVGDLAIDLVHHGVRLGAETIDLTGREFDLLAYLARHVGKVCTHQMILRDVWGPEYGTEANYLRVYTHRLRKKLGDDEGRILRTHPGVGYELCAPA